MNTRCVISRPGRLARTPCSVVLPQIHVEVGTNPPKTVGELPVAGPDFLWDLPNTWPMMRYEVRFRRVASPPAPLADEGDYTFFNPFPASDECGVGLVRMVSAYSRRFEKRFLDKFKPLEYAILLAGIDAENPRFEGGPPGQSGAITLCRNVDDGYIWPNNGNRFTSQPVLFRPNGTAVCKSYFAGTASTTGAFESMRTALEAASLPLPSLLLCNIETRGDVSGYGPYGLTNQSAPFPTPGNGFVEVADGGQNLTRSQTLDAWRSVRTKNQDGGVLNPNSPLVTTAPTGGRYDPVNWEALHLAASAVTANFADAMAEAIFEPFQAVFGADMLCGEWDVYCATQDHQAPLLPTKRLHLLGGDLSIGVQIPKNYCDVPAGRYNVNPDLYAQNLGWESLWNWLQVYQPAGYTPWTSYPSIAAPDPASEVVQRLVLDVQTQVVRACARAAPDKPLVPSISVGWRQSPQEPAGTDVRRRLECIPFLVRYMINCCLEGATAFYLFAPDWNDGSPADFDDAGNMTVTPITASAIRETNYQLVRQFNSEFAARVPYRNRMFRHVG